MDESKYADIALFRRLLSQARPYWPHIAGIFLISLLSSPLALLTPLPLKIAVDSVIGSHPLPAFLDALLPAAVTRSSSVLLLVAAGLLVISSLLSLLQELASSLLRTYTGEKLVLGFRAQLFHHIQRLSFSYSDSTGTTDSTYRIQYDAPAIQYIAIDGVIPFIAAAVTVTGMIYVTARIDWQLALVALGVSPILFVLTQIYRRRLRKQSREVRKLESSAMSVVQEVLSAIRVVKAFGQEQREQERFVRRSGEGVQARIHLALAEGVLGLVVGLTIALGTSAVLFIGVSHVQAGVLTLGELLLVMGYLAQLYAPLKTMSKKVASLQSHLAGAERAFSLLGEPSDVAERPNPRPIVRALGHVTFSNVSFAYQEDRQALHGISFKVPAGTRLGIAGATGAGKTTLVSLLTRFYDPTAGQILLDGVDLRDYKLADLRNQFAIVLQEPVLFSTSIIENIAYARPEASDREIMAAAQAAGAHEFIARLPQGYDTLVGERGMSLSGGERQRIALARAFLKDAPILILDEPTSSVDIKTEAAIMEAMERLMRGRTTFMIAHRLSTLANCDVILRIENGRLVEVRPDVSTTIREALASDGRDATFLEAKLTTETTEIIRADPLEHPSVKAWSRLLPERVEPEGVEILHERKKTAICRLYGVGLAGSAVIAKRCTQADGAIERTIYQEVLPRLPMTTLYYYGLVEEPDGNFCWLFLEDAAGENYSPYIEEHRALAAQWLGHLHTSAVYITAAVPLPERGPGHYLEHLQSGRAKILRNLTNPKLKADDRVVLEDILSQCDFLESRWQQVEEFCAEVPRTLVHGDFTGKNLRVRTGQAGAALLAFDWEKAGWGIPAIDLAESALWGLRGLSANPDIPTYWLAVRDHWPSFDLQTLQRLANCGTMFRCLAAINWKAPSLVYEGVRWVVEEMRIYQAELSDAIQSAIWAE